MGVSMGVYILLRGFFSWNWKRLAFSLSCLRKRRWIVSHTICHFTCTSRKTNVFHGSCIGTIFPAWTSCRMEAITNWKRHWFCHVYIIFNCCHILQRDYGLLPTLHLLFVFP